MASNVIPPGGNEQLNFYRMTRVVVELFRDVLWEILIQHVKPLDIPSDVKLFKNKLNLLPEQYNKLCQQPKGNDLRASDVDVSILYQLLRNICPGLLPPTNGWGNPSSPHKTIADDIEWIRLKRNNHMHNRAQAKLPDDTFNDEYVAIVVIMKRIDLILHTTFEKDLEKIGNCTLDHEHVKQLGEDMDKQQTRMKAVEDLLENVVTKEELKEELDKRLAVEPISRKRPGVTSLTERRSKTSQSAKVVPPRSADKDDVESEIYRQDSITSPDSGSFRVSSTSSSSTSLDFDKDFAKYEHDMPPEIKIGYYDCLILYCEDDRKVARLFCDHLINDIVLQKHGPVRAVLYDSAELISLTEAKLKRLEMGVARCTYVFVYLTEQFVADKWMDVSSEICLMKAINDPEKQWSVVPVYTEKPSECRFKIPTILDRLIGIDYYKIDSHYQIRVARLIQDRIATRVENEKRHRLEQKTWIEEKKRSDADQEMEFKKLALKEERKTEEHKLTKTEEHKLTEEQHLQPPSFTTVDSDIQDNFNFHEWAISSGLKSTTIRLLEAEDLDTRESLFHLADDMIQIDQSLTALSLGQKILLKTSIRKLINVVYSATIQITSEEYSAEIAAAGRNIYRLAITQKINDALQKVVSDSIPGQALIRIKQYGPGSLMVTFDIYTDGQQTEEEIVQLLKDTLTSGNLGGFTVSPTGFVFKKIRGAGETLLSPTSDGGVSPTSNAGAPTTLTGAGETLLSPTSDGGVSPTSNAGAPTTLTVATLPAEITRMDDQSIQLYKKALSEGETSVHSIRVMVVGHSGVGKTTLTRRLLEEVVDIDATDSTDGIDVHVRRCRVSLDDQSWTVFKEGEKVDTTDKKLAEVLSKQSSSITSPRTLKTDDDTQTKSGEKVDTTFKKEAEVLSKQSSSETKNEPVRSEGGLDEVDTSVVTQTKSDVGEKIDIVEEAVESDMSENAILKHLKDFILNVGKSDDKDNADLSLWDFAGQQAFYTTHQMFLSSRAIYLLVTDISKNIEDVVGDDVCYFDSKGKESYKISEFVNLWMNSIHCCSPQDKPTVPPIILVGTHADGLDQNQATKEEQENKYFEAVRNIFNEKVTARHVVDKDFSINNAIIDPNLAALKQKIFEVATGQDYWGERIPVNWLMLERALGKLSDKGRKIITHSELMDVNNSMPVPIASEYLDLFLRFQHESGNILYFNDPDLRDIILIHPQWLIDCLKSLITAKMFCSQPQIVKQWKELHEVGILRPNLIDAVWQLKEKERFLEHKNHLVLLMEKLNIIAPSDGDDIDPYHLVPCMLKDPPTPVCIKSDCVTMVTTPVLCITTADGFLHAGIFQRLLAACIGKWKISKQGKKNLIYCGYGCFDVDDFHRVMLYFRDCVIQMWVTRDGDENPQPSAEVCAQVRGYVDQELQRISTCLAQLSNLKLSIKCLKCRNLEVYGQFSVEDLLEHHRENDKRLEICREQEEISHAMTCSDLLRHWYGNDLISSIQDNHYHSVLSPDMLEGVPSDKQLNQIASKIGKEYERLGLELGLLQVEIDRIKIDNPYNVLTQTVHILLLWQRKNASRATFHILEQAMLSVHIDAAKALAGIR